MRHYRQGWGVGSLPGDREEAEGLALLQTLKGRGPRVRKEYLARSSVEAVMM